MLYFNIGIRIIWVSVIFHQWPSSNSMAFLNHSAIVFLVWISIPNLRWWKIMGKYMYSVYIYDSIITSTCSNFLKQWENCCDNDKHTNNKNINRKLHSAKRFTCIFLFELNNLVNLVKWVFVNIYLRNWKLRIREANLKSRSWSGRYCASYCREDDTNIQR